MKKILVSLLSLALILSSLPIYAFGVTDEMKCNYQKETVSTYKEEKNTFAGSKKLKVVPDDSFVVNDISENFIIITPLKDEINLVLKDSDGKVMDLYADPKFETKITGKIYKSESALMVYSKSDTGLCLIAIVEEPEEVKFSDVKGDEWYAQYIDQVAMLGMIKGQEVDGKLFLKPENKATRIEGAIFVLRMIGIETKQFKDVKLKYDDYDENSYATAWSANYVKAATKLGLINGSKEGNKLYLHGQDPISRQEFFALYARTIRLIDNSQEYQDFDLTVFEDYKEIKPWFVDVVKYLANAEIIDGKVENGKTYLNPQGDIRRCEIIKMISLF